MRNWPENQVILVMIRHGAAKSNREHRYLGKEDEPLSEEGRRELAEYKSLGCYPAVDGLFVSPMKRCVQTAEILYPGLTPVCIKEWEEMDFGEFEGKNYQELREDKRYQKWIDSGGTLPFPGGEGREDFSLRCEKGFRKMMEKAGIAKKAGPGKKGKSVKTLGMIVHGGTIMALMERYAGGNYFDYQAANGKGYLCTCMSRSLESGIEPVIIKQRKI